MKTPAVLALLACGMASAAPETDRSAWQWEQSVVVPAAGMVRLDLPPPTLDATRADLADLRLVSPAGVETPYLIEIQEAATAREQRAANFKAALVEAAPRTDAATVLECTTGTGEAIQAVTLESPARDFLKSIMLEGTRDGAAWQPLASREVVFRQANGAERLRIPLPAGVWQHLRITVSDVRSTPVAFTGVTLTLADSKPPETNVHAVSLEPASQISDSTRLTLDLGAANLHLADLRLDVTDPVFSRNYSLAYLTTSADGQTALTPVTKGFLFRVLGEPGSSAEQLVIAIRQRIPAKQLVLTLVNGDSPPLHVTGAGARSYPTTLAWHAAQPGNWRMLSGNPRAAIPRYDLAPLRGELSKAGGQRVSPGPLQAKADFQVPPALPGVDPAGATIDLTKWTRRRAVQVAAAGVIRIELDPPALANSHAQLNDLRLVQDGRQIPYLIENNKMRTINAAIAERPDPKRPSVSRWLLTLPLENLPVYDLIADSPSPLFTRTFKATTERKDELGNVWIETLGTATWTKTATPNGSSSSFSLGFGGTRLPAEFWLEADNGDNPPIKVENIRLHYAAPLLAAKLVSATPLFLYYGNPQAAAPAYDLRLVRAELLAADKQASTLGAEEVLKPDAAKPWAITAGSPWLWAALALVVVLLLVIVAKLLPKPQ
ncbi:MAG: DUF3999 family protein [Verrucomicrobiota bacterium]